jgi:hypothetical protein
MKNILHYTGLFFVVLCLSMTSCKKDHDHGIRTYRSISIASLREMYKGEPMRISDDEKNSQMVIRGVVISASIHQNNPAGRIIVQNSDQGKIRGIVLALEGQITRYLAGDSIVANVEGATLERKDGILQVSGLTLNEVGRVSIDNAQAIHVETDNLGDILANKEVYESTLVKVRSVEVADLIRGQKFGDKDLTLTDGVNQLKVKTRATATFAGVDIPISGDFTGILLSTEGDGPYLSVRSSSDFSGVYMAPDSYTGFAEGWENIIGARKAGSVSTSGFDEYPSGRWRLFQALTRGNDPQFHNTRGSWTMMMSGAGESIVGMEFDLLFGASKISFYYGAATKLAGDAGTMNLIIEYSVNSGQSWQQLGAKVIIPNDPARPQFYLERDNLNIKDTVRFRIRKEAGGGRVTIDDIDVKPNP